MTQTEHNARIARIARMEEIMDAERDAADALEAALVRYCTLEADMRELTAYYTGGQWLRDYEADEAGRLPETLKRGVLSQDAVYDLLAKRTELAQLCRRLAKQGDDT